MILNYIKELKNEIFGFIVLRLADLCTVVDCSLAQIFRIAAHLIYWRKAKIIDVISVRNIYVVSPTADMNS